MIDGTAPAVRRAARRVRWRERVFHVAARLSPRGEPGDDRWYTGALILLYHRVVGDRDRSDDPFAVSRSRFEAQLDWLASRFQLASVGTVADRLVAGAGVEGWLAISFDDGYADTWTEAWPALRARGATATVFVDTGRLDTGRPALSELELRALASEGMEIGSHSVTHRDLIGLADLSLTAELSRSREALAAIVGGPVRGFAYPFGRYDRRVRDAVRAAGYTYACSCRQHETNRQCDDAFGLKRVEVNGTDDGARFTDKVSGRYARFYRAWYALSSATRWWLTES